MQVVQGETNEVLAQYVGTGLHDVKNAIKLIPQIAMTNFAFMQYSLLNVR